ncbi:MAG: type Z 30S ribosomal protein S14 [Vampirovibrio sp.]|nr:type Z 30S ribosomal protein S14 [Vampirovibrio sp.]
MAKTSMIVKEQKHQALALEGKFPKTRLRNRCSICGRPRGYYRQFGICRLCLRKYAHEGKIPGVTKSSW